MRAGFAEEEPSDQSNLIQERTLVESVCATGMM